MNTHKTLLQLATLGVIASMDQQAHAQGAPVSVTDYDEATSEYQEAYVNGT